MRETNTKMCEKRWKYWRKFWDFPPTMASLEL